MVTIRPMTAADLQQVLVIEQSCFPRPWTRDHFLSELASPYACAAVAVQDGRVAGYFCLTVVLDEAELLDIAVDPAVHGQGVGRRLLLRVCEEARKRNAGILRLEVRATSQPAISLYERFGFVRSGLRKAYYEQGIDALLMEKNLTEEDVEQCSLRQ